MHLKCKWIEVGEANFSYFRLGKLYLSLMFVLHTMQCVDLLSIKNNWKKENLFSNYRQIVMSYFLAIYVWDLTVTEIYNSTIKTNWSVLLSSRRKEEHFCKSSVNWYSSIYFYLLFWPCFFLNHMVENIYKGKTLTS